MATRIETFAVRLKRAIDMNGITQTELAKRAHISKSSITRYIKGDWEGKQDAVYQLALALNVSEAWLMGYDVPTARTVNTETSPTESEAKRCFEALSEAHKAEALNFLRYLATREDRE